MQPVSVAHHKKALLPRGIVETDDCPGALPRPAPQAGELRIRVEASAISHADLLRTQGRYQMKPPVPYIPGSELAGTVEAMGDGVDGDWRPGQRICGSGARSGAWAEALCIPAATVQRLEGPAPFAQAAARAVPYATMWHALVDRGALLPGETVFVLGAAGSVGLALAAGVDAVGGPFTEAAFRCLGWGGRHLVLDFSGGAIAALPANLPLLKGAAHLRGVMGLHARGDLRPAIDSEWPLTDYRQALAAMQGGEAVGRVVLRPN